MAVFAQDGFPRQGTEYALAGALPGDQVHPQVSLTSSGGYVVWQDNAIDNNGLGIGAMQLDGSFTGSGVPFRVNQLTQLDQENPQVSLLNGGGAVFVWQGGKVGFQHIFARFLSASNSWLAGEVMVNSYTNNFQITPAVTTLANGNVVVVWSSVNQRAKGSLQDIYLQIYTPTGQKVLTNEFAVNQFQSFNQRSPAVAALADGKFVVAWVSEQQRWTDLTNGVPSVDVYARIFDPNGAPQGSVEFLVNSNNKICANPSITASADGGYSIAWMEKDMVVRANGWDIYARTFIGSTGGAVSRLNTQLYGDQYLPRIAAAGTNYLVVWTSLIQDGSREGLYGQVMSGNSALLGDEFRVNTTVFGSQMHPGLASDGTGRFIVTWTSFAPGGFNLQAQRYADPSQPLFAPAPPTVAVVSSNSLLATWPFIKGLDVDHYEIYADGAVTATVSNSWTMTGLELGSTHTFQLAYVLAGDQHSPLSATVSATTFDTTQTTNSSVTPPPDPNQNSQSKTNVTISGGQSILTLPPQVSGSGSIPLSAASGLYNGLFYSTNGVTVESSGYATINVTTRGSFSGKLLNRGQSYSFSGQFDSTGHSSGFIARKGASPLAFDLQLDLQGGEQITGRISTGLWEAALQTYRVGLNPGNPLSLAGRYTFVIPGDGVGINAPGGNGVATVSLDAAGNIQWSGFLADGSTVGQKTTLSKNNVWPLYAPLYNGGGLAIGWVQMETNSTLSGEAVWGKSSGSSGAYPSGYTNSITISGSPYKVPPVGFTAFGNAQVRFNGNNAGFTNSVFWGGTKIFNRSANTLSVSLTPATGLFKGTVIEPGTGNKLSFQGVLLENNNAGAGYFLKNGQSGVVDFAPAP